MMQTPRGNGVAVGIPAGEQNRVSRRRNGRAGKQEVLSVPLPVSFETLLKSARLPDAAAKQPEKAGKGQVEKGKEPLVSLTDKKKISVEHPPGRSRPAPVAGEAFATKTLGEAKQGMEATRESPQKKETTPLKGLVRQDRSRPAADPSKDEGKASISKVVGKDLTGKNLFVAENAQSEPPTVSKTKGKEETQRTVAGKTRTDNEPSVETGAPVHAVKEQVKGELPKTIELRFEGASDFLKKMEPDPLAQQPEIAPQAKEYLLHQLQERGNHQIVQQAQFFLKNREDGEIRLVLKPEQLGEVRIQLNVRDRLIEGHITVENSIVKELFEQNRAELSQAFKEQGFYMSQLDVSVGDNPNRQHNGEKSPVPIHAKAGVMAEHVPSLEADRSWIESHQWVDYYA